MRKLTGLLYKEFYLNRFSYLALLIGTLVCENISILVRFTFTKNDAALGLEGAEAIMSVFDIFGAMAAFFFAQSMTKALFSHDENKAWASFILSTPARSHLQVLSKYESTLILNIALFILSTINCAIQDIFYTKLIPISNILLFALFFNLLVFAIEAPFMFRYSTKYADAARIIPFLLVFFSLMLYLLFGDISFLEEHGDDFIEYLIEVFTRKRQAKALFIAFAALPYVSIVSLIASYKISCKVYRKGVASYAK